MGRTAVRVENDLTENLEELQLATIAAQAGFCNEENLINRTGHGKAICTASVYEFESLEEYMASAHTSYRRFGHSNSDDMAHAIVCLESAEAGLATSSGMGAIVCTVLSLMKGGDTVLVHADTNGGTNTFFDEHVRRFGMNVEFVDVLDVVTLETALSRCKDTGSGDSRVLIFFETITNPLLRVADVTAISSVCKRFGALVVVDNTFGTPLRSKPLLQGADVVVHSATKFLGGHNDLIAGAVVGSAKLVNQAKAVAGCWGLTVSPFEAWLCTRSIRTLQIRLERAWTTSEKLAVRLRAEKHGILEVNSAPKCAVLSFLVVGGLHGVKTVIKTLGVIKFAPSLGGVTTTVSHPASDSHFDLRPEERERLGIHDGLIRLSVGIEDFEDISSDLLQAVRAAVVATPEKEDTSHIRIDGDPSFPRCS
ncbi:hypothetical protein R1sor_023219 [Riccia sorocarpa]|uniref:Cystathionine gamma-synthase n=1 Tax=Riccia sorocarpa TaxID=122646 RepID=A0ABD3GM45_9MARC